MNAAGGAGGRGGAGANASRKRKAREDDGDGDAGGPRKRTAKAKAALAPADVPDVDRLVFHSRSAGEPRPGEGAEEHVADPLAYAGLAAIPNWRRVLSNFDASVPFVFRGRTYRTIEHAFQAAKIALADDAKARTFALESGSALSAGDGDAARAARKAAVLSAAQLAVWDAQSEAVMAEAARAKYAAAAAAPAASPQRLPATVLLATGHAQLCHFIARKPSGRNLHHFQHLEHIRDALLLGQP